MIELPVVETGLNIGTIDLNLGKVTATNVAQITFSCTSRIECCSNLTIPVTDFDVDRILDHGYELDQIVTELSPIILPIKGTRSMTERVYA
ncbi:MAG: hypothetical protein IH840_11835, partial [Candidatus Heimdallarchaeota archaeon]|nr:hypothetical protein [Candidatus Heimdallarchaeota archaeon]